MAYIHSFKVRLGSIRLGSIRLIRRLYSIISSLLRNPISNSYHRDTCHGMLRHLSPGVQIGLARLGTSLAAHTSRCRVFVDRLDTLYYYQNHTTLWTSHICYLTTRITFLAITQLNYNRIAWFLNALHSIIPVSLGYESLL